MSKSIEEMIQEYTVAYLRGGVGCDSIPVDKLVSLAEEVKRKGEIKDQEIEKWRKEDQRRRW